MKHLNILVKEDRSYHEKDMIAAQKNARFEVTENPLRILD